MSIFYKNIILFLWQHIINIIYVSTASSYGDHYSTLYTSVSYENQCERARECLDALWILGMISVTFSYEQIIISKKGNIHDEKHIFW